MIWRHSARVILIDDEGRLVLIKRTRPGEVPYWTTAGGGVEESDTSVEAAMHRELAEELGAKATAATRVFLFSEMRERGLSVAHFFVARLVSMDVTTRTGPEFADPSRGAYDPDRVDLRGDALQALDLRPVELKAFILTNREALLTEVASSPNRLARRLPAGPGTGTGDQVEH